MEDQPLVLIERHGSRGELVLNRPEKRNALTGPLVQQLHAGLDELVADDSVSVILIRGAGGCFCAGRDRDAFAAEPRPDWVADFGSTVANFHAAMYACPKPTVGALEKAAIAAGSALALSCDFLVAGEGARFHVAEVNMGMAAPVNLVWLCLKFGMARALEFAVGGQPYGGRELVARGIAVRSAPDDRVLDEARAYAGLLARNTPAAMVAVKATIRAMIDVDDFRTQIARAQATNQAQPGLTRRGER